MLDNDVTINKSNKVKNILLACGFALVTCGTALLCALSGSKPFVKSSAYIYSDDSYDIYFNFDDSDSSDNFSAFFNSFEYFYDSEDVIYSSCIVTFTGNNGDSYISLVYNGGLPICSNDEEFTWENGGYQVDDIDDEGDFFADFSISYDCIFGENFLSNGNTSYSAFLTQFELTFDDNTMPSIFLDYYNSQLPSNPSLSSDDWVSILGDIVSLLTGGIVGLSGGIGSGVSTLVSDIFVSNNALSVFGGVIVVFAAISLAIGLCRWVMNFLTSLGAKK